MRAVSLSFFVFFSVYKKLSADNLRTRKVSRLSSNLMLERSRYVSHSPPNATVPRHPIYYDILRGTYYK